MDRISSLTLGAAVALSITFSAARGSANWPERIPNGYCGVCHVSSSGGGTRTSFGKDFEFGPNGSSDGSGSSSDDHRWSSWLCSRDSDGDGWTNGQELGDPFCETVINTGGDASSPAAPPGAAHSNPGSNGSTPPDINFCTTTGYNPCDQSAAGNCSSNAGNNVPDFSCWCDQGFSGTGQVRGGVYSPCSIITECVSSPPNCGTGTCSDRTPGYTCNCPSTSVLVGTWTDGSLRCVDGCDPSIEDCVSIATCVPISTSPNFRCDCPDPGGYTGNGRAGEGCNNIDECAGGDPCGIGASRASACTDLTPHIDGARYSCTCSAGFTFDGTTCVDIDECAVDSTRCGPGICGDSVPPAPPATWTCSCNAGYRTTGGPTPVCVDIDECADPTLNTCSTHATCTNLPGTFDCTCIAGYEGDGFNCIDIDECATMTDECDPNATCANNEGSYSCTCNAYWQGPGITCTDIDECAAGTSGCGLHERCVNQVGAPALCPCEPGYSRTGSSATCAVACGDGQRGPGEECDDGNTADDDGCNAACAVEDGWVCLEDGAGLSTCSASCGDGLIDPGEECDDAAANDDTAPDACRTDCRFAHCGDAVVDTGEACDDGDANSDTASNACRTTCDSAYCGDGVVDQGEMCDPGGGVPGASVVGTCTTLCFPDAGIDPSDPPSLNGGAGCSAAPSGSAPTPMALLGLVALFLVRRRRR